MTSALQGSSPSPARNARHWLAGTSAWTIAIATGILWPLSLYVGEPPASSGPFAVTQHSVVLPLSAADAASGEHSDTQVELLVSYPAKRPSGAPPMPLLLYAPGWGQRAAVSQSLHAELASYGYIVCAFDDIAFAPRGTNESESDYATRTSQIAYTSDEHFAASMRRGDARLAWQTAHAQALLDAISQRAHDGTPPFRDIDLQRIGAVGFSFGGATAAEFAHNDPRVRVTVNLDGGLFGQSAHEGLVLPYLMLATGDSFAPNSDLASRDPARRLNAEWCRSDQALHARSFGQAGFTFYEIRNARHSDLTDELFTPGWRRSRLRHTWRERLSLRHTQVNAMKSFLDRYLKPELPALDISDDPRLRVVTRVGPP